jgi:F0F1-type ATP synthase assembly protein I
MAEDQDAQEKEGRGFGTGYAIVGAGFQLVFSMLFFMWLGSLLDRKTHTAPLFLLIGLMIGLAAGFYAFWIRVTAESKERK